MKKSSSKKKAEPPRRSTMAELLKKMEEEAEFRIDKCPNRKFVLLDGVYSCSLAGQIDVHYSEDGYHWCDFEGRDYRDCPVYKAGEGDKKKRPSLSDLEDKV